jgi:hypothetical protein
MSKSHARHTTANPRGTQNIRENMPPRILPGVLLAHMHWHKAVRTLKSVVECTVPL